MSHFFYPMRMRVILHYSIRALSLVVIGGLLVVLLIPLLTNTVLLPHLLSRLPVDRAAANLCSFRLFSVSGSLALQNEQQTIISLPRITLTHTPLDLLGKKGGTLQIEQAVVHLQQHNGRYRLRGWPNQGDQANPSMLSAALMPFAIDRLHLSDCTLILHDETGQARRLSVSTDLHLSFQRQEGDGFRLQNAVGTVELSDLFSTSGTISLATGPDSVDISLLLEELDARPLRDLLPAPLRDSPLGRATLSAQVVTSSDYRDIRQIEVQTTLHQPDLAAAPLSLQGTDATGEIRWRVVGPPHDLQVTVNPVALVAPSWRIEAAVRGRLSWQRDVLSGTGAVDLTVSSSDLEVPLAFTYQALVDGDGRWRLEIDGQTSGPLLLPEYRGIPRITAGPVVTLGARLNGQSNHVDAALSLTVPKLELTLPATAVAASQLQAAVTFASDPTGTNARLSGTVKQVRLADGQAGVDDLTVVLPLTWNDESQADAAGSIAAASLFFRGASWAALSGEISRSEGAIGCTGRVRAQFFPHPELSFSTHYRLKEHHLQLDWRLPVTLIDSANLPARDWLPGDFSFQGRLASQGQLQFTGSRFTGAAELELLDGTALVPERGLAVSGMACSLHLPRLPLLISAPSQICRAASVDIGTLHFSDATIAFRVEDPTTIFIEKSRAGWCQGTVESGSVRLSSRKPEVETVLYASRLNFAEVLNQFGFDQTEGEGTLNGKLPVRWADRRLFFDDGFLFSTPGTGGIVRFTSTELLRQGIGAASQNGSLNYSVRALEDFAYNWTKVTLNSSADELLMALELDGQPRTPLPFSFKDGALVESQQGSLQYPVRLDINVRLPLNELLQVGHNVKTIMGNR